MGFKAQSGATQQDQQGPLISTVGGRRYEVYDGDTIYELDEEDKRISGGLRLQGIQARETAKTDKFGNIVAGQLGGDESKFILYDYLNKKGDNLDRVDIGEQTLGRGAGQRGLVDFVDKNTGTGLATSFAEADISPVTSWETKDDYEARRMGRLSRQIVGSDRNDGLDELRALNPGQAQPKGSGYGVFKGLALNEAWYDPDYHTGVKWRNNDRTLWNEEKGRGGFAKDPLGVAWDSGWTNAAADAGAFLNSFGVVLDNEWLQDKGDAITLRQNQITQENPNLAVQSLSDISADGYWDTIKNSVEWLGVNSAMSIPYMAAIGASAVGAGVLAPVTGTVAATGLAILPAFSLHAGSTWNQLDTDKKTRGNAGKVYLAGLAMTMLDRLSLGNILKPGQLLTKEGQEKAIKHIAIREGISDGAAKIIFNKAARDETVDFLEHNVASSAQYLREGKILKDTLAGFARAAPVEAVTEVMQELTSYITAQRINGEQVDMKHALDIAANSAAAGFFIGGIAGSGGAFIGGARDARTAKQYRDGYDPTLDNEYVQALEAYENDPNTGDTSIEGSINKIKAGRRIQDKDRPEISERDDGLFGRLATAGKDISTLKDLFVKQGVTTDPGDLELTGGISADKTEYVVPGVGETLSAVGKVASRLTRASTRVELRPEDIARNKAYLQLFQRLDFHGTTGRNYEGRRDSLSGTFDAIVGDKKILASLGFARRADPTKAFSRELDELGTSGFLDSVEDAGWNIGKMSQTDLDKHIAKMANGNTDPKVIDKQGWARDRLQKYAYGAMRMKNATNAQRDAEISAMKLEHGADSKIVKDLKDSYRKDYYWKTNIVSKSKVASDPEAFTKLVNDRKAEALKDTNLSKEERKALNSVVPIDITRSIMEGVSLTGDDISLVDGSKWANRSSKVKLLNLESDPKFMEKWGSDNRFDILRAKGSDVAKKVAHLEFFGDGGRDLDIIMRKAIDIDVNQNGMTEADATKKAQSVASDYKSIIDASSQNYNRIKNPKVAKMQRAILSYTTLVGLGLSGPASIPEFATIALDMASFKEARTALGTAGKTIGKTMWNAAQEEKALVGDRLSSAIGTPNANQEKVVDNAMFNTLQQIGVPAQVTDVYNKWGAEGGEPLTETFQGLQSGFFKYITFIHGITQIQRQMNAAFGTDFAKARLLTLMNADLDGKMSRKQGEAHAQLKGLGMDVRLVLDVLRRNSDADFDKGTIDRSVLEYDTDTISELQEQAIANDMTVDQQRISNARSKNFDNVDDAAILKEQMGLFLQNFVNQRIQNPGAANRALIVQDPRFHLITQFNGFVSTITTTIVPKLWNDKVGQAIRKKDPTLAYDAFAMVAVLVILGASGQWLRDWIKHGDEYSDPFDNPRLDSGEVVRRALGSSGILGQFEKPLNWFAPQSYQQDEAFGVRVGSEFGGPILQHLQNIKDAADHFSPSEVETSTGGTYTKAADPGAALNDFLKSVPLTSVLPRVRHNVVEAITDKQYK